MYIHGNYFSLLKKQWADNITWNEEDNDELIHHKTWYTNRNHQNHNNTYQCIHMHGQTKKKSSNPSWIPDFSIESNEATNYNTTLNPSTHPHIYYGANIE